MLDFKPEQGGKDLRGNLGMVSRVSRGSYRSCTESPAAASLSLLVVFDNLGWPHLRLIWITSGISQSLKLAQEVPALI